VIRIDKSSCFTAASFTTVRTVASADRSARRTRLNFPRQKPKGALIADPERRVDRGD